MLLREAERKIKDLLSIEFNQEYLNDFYLTLPPEHIKADFSSTFALSLAKKEKKNPKDIAEKISKILNEKGLKTTLANSFLNIEISDLELLNNIEKYILDENYFKVEENKNEKINLEFISANPTGPLHLASGLAASLGDGLGRIYKKLGFFIKTEYYINNVGNQVVLLGESLKARFLKTDLPENAYQGEYLIDIAKTLPEEAKNWEIKQFSNFAVKKIIELQKKDIEDFNVNFDTWFEESYLHEKNLPAETLKELKDKKMAYEKDGAIWLGLVQDNNDDKDRVLVKSDGKNTYFLNDLAYHKNKFERGFNKLIDIWGADHHGYVPRLKAGISALGFGENSLTIIIHQLVSLKKGNQIVKMSKRAGEFVSLRELIEEVGTDASRFFFSMRSVNTHLTFDLDLAKKRTNENPVFYTQYVYARINSIFENAKLKKIPEDLDFKGYSLNEEEKKILIKSFYLEKVLFQCIKDLSLHHLTTYLIELASMFHSFYDKYKVIDETSLLTSSVRLKILKAVSKSIKEGLFLLGVSTPDKM